MSRDKLDDWVDRGVLTLLSSHGLLALLFFASKDGVSPFEWFCYGCAAIALLSALFRLWRERVR